MYVIWIVPWWLALLILFLEAGYKTPAEKAEQRAAEKAAETEAKRAHAEMMAERRRLAPPPPSWRTNALFFVGLFAILSTILAARAITGN